jgi:hypothetical protein
MQIDTLTLFFKLAVLLIYGGICIMGLIFGFALDVYRKINELLNLEFFSRQIVNPLDIHFTTIDDWLAVHNKIVGPLLAALALIDIIGLFNIIDTFA